MSLSTTIIWIALPFFSGFLIYLVPRLDRALALVGALASTAYAMLIFTSYTTGYTLGQLSSEPLTLRLLDRFGVTLVIDELSGYFILTNALVTLAVVIYCWNSGRTAFFYAQMLMMHGSVNAAFACADFISLYVALEVSGIAAFLLIAHPRTDRSIWVGLRYLFISNTAMLFYLIGAVLVYKATLSFSFAGLGVAPPEALALIFMGLLVKGGVFVSGLWLPLTHSEAETPVSALLSGVVVKAGVYPLLRCALMVEPVDPIVRIFSVATTLLGVFYAVFEKDTKRTLALSTISQLGWVLAAPAVGGFYALAHGLGKAAMFLAAGTLPSRDFKELQQQPINRGLWVVFVVAGLSISGLPLLAGFGAKMSTLQQLLPFQTIAMNLAAVGTAIVYAKFIALPHEKQGNLNPGFLGAVAVLIAGLLIANLGYLQAYTPANVVKAVAIIGTGWLVYFLLARRTAFRLPRMLEQFEHLIGMMSVMAILLFWMVLA